MSLKPAIFAASPAVGNAFERKEHLALAVVTLSWTGLVAHWAAQRERESSVALGELASVAYIAAAGLATLTAGLGLAVAVQHSF